jgi:hypothetical protein
MTKSTSRQKKRTAARRRRCLKKLKRLSVKQKLARQAKERRSLANLIAALNRFSPSTTGAIEPECEKELPQLKLDKSLLNSATNSQGYPQKFGRQQLHHHTQQKHSLTKSLSLLQWLTAPLKIEAAIVRHEAALLCLVAPRRETLAPVGGSVQQPESTSQKGSHLRELIQNPSTPSALFAVTKPIFSSSIAPMPSPEKPLHQERPLRSPPSSGDPAIRWSSADRMEMSQALLKLVKPAKGADNSPRAEQSSSNNIKRDTKHKQLAFAEPLQAIIGPIPAIKHLRKNVNFIKKLSYPDKKLLQRCLNSAKNRRCLGQPEDSILRLCGWSRADDISFLRRYVKLLVRGHEHLEKFHSRSIKHGQGRSWLKKNQAASSTDGHCQLSTLIPPAAVLSVHSSPAVTINHEQVVANLSRREHSPSNDTKEDIEHNQFVFEIHFQKYIPSRQASKTLKNSGGVVRKSACPDKKTYFLRSNNPDTMAENAHKSEQLSHNSKNSRINCRNFTMQTLFQRGIISPQVSSSPSCCPDHLLKGGDPIPERDLAEQPVENFRLLQGIASACSCNEGCDEHSYINSRHPSELLPINQVHSGDCSWI